MEQSLCKRNKDIIMYYIMGCDYYITKVLNIYCENDDYLRFVIDREKRYYHYVYDSDDEAYETEVNEYIKKCLTPQTEPIVLFNNKFIKSNYETKYKSIVERFIKDCGKKFSDITKIIKVEQRYERNK